MQALLADRDWTALARLIGESGDGWCKGEEGEVDEACAQNYRSSCVHSRFTNRHMDPVGFSSFNSGGSR